MAVQTGDTSLAAKVVRCAGERTVLGECCKVPVAAGRQGPGRGKMI